MNKTKVLLIIIICVFLQSTSIVAAEPDPGPGEVLFGADVYQFGENMKIICQGQWSTNDEVWLLYGPDGQWVMTYDPDLNSKIGNEYFYHEADRLGTWTAVFWARTLSGWEIIYESSTEVIDTIPPGDVTGLSQIDSNPSSINLAWNAANDNDWIHHYDVEIRKSGQTSVNRYDFSKTTARIDNLQSGTLYDVRVRAVDLSSNLGQWSSYVSMSTENEPPTATIDYITPASSFEGKRVSFRGFGTDSDGTIRSYSWRSSLDGYLSNSGEFSTTGLSAGRHTIYFKVKDNAEEWSREVSELIQITQIPPQVSVSISSSNSYPTVGDTYTVTVTAKNTGGTANAQLKLYENGKVVRSKEKILSKGSQTKISYSASKSSSGIYDYKGGVSLSNDAGSSSSSKSIKVYVYPGTERINLNKDEYYVPEMAIATASNHRPSLSYKVRWYKNGGLIGNSALFGDTSKRSVSGNVGEIYTVELTKPDGSAIASDSAKVVIEPLNLKIGVILAKPNDQEPDSGHDKQYYNDILTQMHDYYVENSYGRINIDISESDIFDNDGNWYTVPHDNKYYGQNRSADGKDYTFKFRDDAIAAVSASVSFSPNDYDIIAVVHPKDCQQTSHNHDDMKTAASGYSFVMSENDRMGTWAHEAGHVIGRFEKNGNSAPDRYKNGDLNYWDLMASGNYVTDENGVSYPSHMSSWTKEYMGWLEYDINNNFGTYWVPALEQMQYGDDVVVYDVLKQNGMNKYSYILEVRSENVGVWDSYLYDDKTEYYDMLVIYQVNTTSIGSRSDVVNIFDTKDILFDNDMVLLTLNEEYHDSNAEILIKLDTTIGELPNGYGGNVAIEELQISNQNGGAISTTGNPSNIDFISSTKDMNLTLPDYDLHAFTQDGRHVGVNYTSGDYENQIDGATTSGDLLGGVEWIFVPEYEDVKFMVSNHDTEEFLKKYPGAANITADMKYNLNIYHEDSRSIRYDAGVTEQQIAPGKERNYLFNIVENIDGTFTIILDHEPPVISSANPSNNSIVGKEYNISADYEDEGTGVDINSVKLEVDGIDVTYDAIITESFLLYTPLLEDGKHTFEMMVADNMENTATLNHSFTVDTTLPEVDIIYPINNSFVHETVEIKGIATDLHLDAVSIEINDIEVSNNPGFMWDTMTYADGSHTIRLKATDVVGNSANTSINVTVDNTPPNVLLNLTNGTEFYSDESWTVDFTATDNLSGIDTEVLTIDGIEWLKDDIVDMRYLSLGEHEVVVSAHDNAGNYNSTSTNFTIKPLQAIVDVSPKTLNINSNGNWVTGFIEVPGYSPELIDISTVILNNTIHAEAQPFGIGDNNENGAPDLMVKFNRSEVQNLIHSGNITLIIEGKVDYAAFSGHIQISVIDNHQNKNANGNKGKGGEKS